jgi:hypothetical protein
VHIVTTILRVKLRNSVFTELVVGSIAMIPVNLAEEAGNKLRQDGEITVSSIVCLYNTM